jgi:hypothetical protein
METVKSLFAGKLLMTALRCLSLPEFVPPKRNEHLKLEEG